MQNWDFYHPHSNVSPDCVYRSSLVFSYYKYGLQVNILREDTRK